MNYRKKLIERLYRRLIRLQQLDGMEPDEGEEEGSVVPKIRPLDHLILRRIKEVKQQLEDLPPPPEPAPAKAPWYKRVFSLFKKKTK